MTWQHRSSFGETRDRSGLSSDIVMAGSRICVGCGAHDVERQLCKLQIAMSKVKAEVVAWFLYGFAEN